MLYQRMNDFYFPLNYFNADRYKSLQQSKRASYSLEDTRQKMVNAKNHSLRLSTVVVWQQYRQK
jgi:hypothetical protein